MRLLKTLLWVLLPLAAFAQKDLPSTIFEGKQGVLKDQIVGEARSNVALAIGMFIPEGSFRSSYEDEKPGYAKMGLHLSADAAYLFSRNVGIGVTGGYMSNAIKTEEYVTDVLKRLPDVENGLLDAGKWSTIYFAAGPYIALPENKFTFDLRILFGAKFVNAPTLAFTADYAGGTLTDTRSMGSGKSMVMVLGAGLSYPLPTFYDFRLFLRGEYIGGSPTFDLEQRTESADFNVVSTSQYQQPAGGFSLSMGVRYEFGY